MPAQHSFEFTADIRFIMAAMRRDLLWRGYLLAGLCLLIGVAMRLVNGLWDPLVTALSVLGAAVILWRFHRLLRTLAGRVFELWTLQSPSGLIRYELDDQGLTVHVGSSSTEFAWSGLRKLWRYGDAWLLEIVKMQSVFFPPKSAPPEVRDYIVERCRTAGVPVK